MILLGFVVGAVVGYYLAEHALAGLVGALLGAGAGLVIEPFGYAENALLRFLIPALRKTPGELVVEEFKRLEAQFQDLEGRADDLALRLDLDDIVITGSEDTSKAVQALLRAVEKPAQS
jgi:hypothetical protein